VLWLLFPVSVLVLRGGFRLSQHSIGQTLLGVVRLSLWPSLSLVLVLLCGAGAGKPGG